MAAFNKYHFIDELIEDNICSICTGLLDNPVLTDCCGQHFCADCLKTWLEKKPTCPQCRKQEFKYINSLPKKRQINALKIYCPNRPQGCEETTTVGECNTHLKTCLFVVVYCTNDCGVRMLRIELVNHIVNDCPKRTVSCQYCKEEGMYKDITAESHIDECPSFPLDCPNNCGHDKIQRKDLPDHQKECPLEPVKCPFFEAGCKQEMPRKELAAHKATNTENHLELMMINLKETKDKIKETKDEMKETKDEMKETKDEMKETKDEMSLKFSGIALCITKQLATIEITPQNKTALHNIKTTLEAMTIMLEPQKTHRNKKYCLPMVITAEGIMRTPSFHIKPGYKMYVNGLCKIILERSEYSDRLTWPMRECEITIHIKYDREHYKHKVEICTYCGLTVNQVESEGGQREIGNFSRMFPGDSILVEVKEHYCIARFL